MKSTNDNYSNRTLGIQIEEKVIFKIINFYGFGLMLQTLGTFILDLVTNQMNFALTKI